MRGGSAREQGWARRIDRERSKSEQDGRRERIERVHRVRAVRGSGRRQGHTPGVRHVCAVRPEGAHRYEPTDSWAHPDRGFEDGEIHCGLRFQEARQRILMA